MKELIVQQKALQAQAANLTPLIREKFKDLDFAGKLEAYREMGSGFMGEESYYTGNIPGTRVSLYDDLHWERHETKYLEEIEEIIQDNFLGAPGENFDTYLATSDNDRVRVFRDMLESCIGKATYDW